MKQKTVAEFMGTAFLLMMIVGSGIMGEALAGGNEAIALLANSIATGAGLFVLIQCFGPISGAHFNPIVSLVETLWGRLDRKNLFAYWVAQFSGAFLGVILAHGMFDQAIIQVSTKSRNAPNLWLSELIATMGLIGTIALAGKRRVEFAPFSIAAYITAAYWFTSSTSFANPAVTVARVFTNTFAGIAPDGVFPFLLAQTMGAVFSFWMVKKVTVPT